jgi:hypothetical protein
VFSLLQLLLLALTTCTILPLMARVKSIEHPLGVEAQPEATDATSQLVAEVPLSMILDSAGVVSSSSYEGSSADASNNDGESRSDNSNDELTASGFHKDGEGHHDCYCRGTSTMGRDRIRTLEAFHIL